MGEDMVKGERVEVIDIDPELGEVNQDEVASKAVDWINVLQHIGGTVQIGVRREEDGTGSGEFITTAAVFRWTSYMPSQRSQVAAVPDEEPAGDPEPEPVAG